VRQLGGSHGGDGDGRDPAPHGEERRRGRPGGSGAGSHSLRGHGPGRGPQGGRRGGGRSRTILASARGGASTAHSPGTRSRHHLRTQAPRGRPHRLDLGGKTDLQSRPRRDPSLSGAFTFAGGRKLLVWRCFPEEKDPAVPKTLPCGTVLSTAPLRVLAGNGTAVRLERVQWGRFRRRNTPALRRRGHGRDGLRRTEPPRRRTPRPQEDRADVPTCEEGTFSPKEDTDTNRRNGRSHDA
jgi:hypothetical protein